MDNFENPVSGIEEFDILGNTQLPVNTALNNNILPVDSGTSGSFKDPLLLSSKEITPLALEEDLTGEISESEIAPIELSSLTTDDRYEDYLIGNLQPASPSLASLTTAETGLFTVNATGEFTIDFLFDAGSYKSEFAVFSITGMEGLTSGSPEYIKEAARRALTNSTEGYVIITDDSDGAKLSGELGESDRNTGNYSGIKSFSMNPGDEFAFMLVPQGKIQEVFDNPTIEGDKRPLFSIASANPDNATQMMQLLDGAADGGVFGIEDLRLDRGSDGDYNDIIFHVKGAAGKATPLIDVVNPSNLWYETPLGGELIDFAGTNNVFNEPSEISVALVNDTGVSQTDGITNDPLLSGSISNASQVASFKAGFNGNPLVDISDSLKSDGSFSLDKEKLEQIDNGSLTDGSRTLTLQAEDSLGNILNTTSFSFTLDTKTEAPTQLSLSGVEGSITNDNTPTITGEAESGSKVELFNGEELVGETTANSPWEITTVALADGVQSITARVTDTAGNVSPVSEVLEFTIDTVAPQLNITSPVAGAALGEGARLTGKLDGTGSEITSLTYQFNGGSEITIPVNDNGEFDVELDLEGLSNGTQTLTITSTDLAGNVTTQDINVNINLGEQDTTAPVITADLTTDSGISDSDKITNNPAIAGTVTDSSEITSFKAGFDDTATENFVDVLADLQTDGSFSFDAAKLKEINGDVDLSEGEHTLKLIAADAAGNTNEVLEFQFTLDTQLPSVTVNNPSADGELTEGAKLTGTVNGTSSEIASLTYQFSGGSEITVPVNENGEFDVELDLEGLGNGAQTLTITSTDLAGNTSSDEISVNVNLGSEDTTAPVITANLTTDSGISDSDKITNNPAITGTVTDSSEITSFKAGFDDTTTENFVDVLAQLQPDGSFSFDAGKLREINGDVDLSEGEHTLKLIAADAAGNRNEVLEFTFNLDTQLPSVTVNNPSADGELSEGARLTGSLDGTGSGIASLTYQFSGGSEITVPVNDYGEFDVELDLEGLSNGAQTLTITSTDLAGNVTTQDINVNIGVVDTTPPTALITSNLIDTPTSLDVTYNEAVSDEAFAADNYTLTISGGDNDGQTVEISSVEKISDTVARLTFATPLTQINYELALGTEIKDLAGNAIAENTTIDFSVAPPAVEISPTNGEEMVALTRETIVRFNAKIDPSTVNDESFYVIANGERLKGRIVVSSTEEFATFFYDKPLPQSTEVRVVVDGDKIKSRSGVAIDGNSDGIAGGIATADFTTLPLTRIEGTDVWGYVYDSYNTNEDGSNIPLEGVVIRLDSLPDVFAVTDENGYFKLEDVPAPDFYVYIDASNVKNAPEGTQYASLGKAFHSVPGQEIQLEMDGEPFDVYLPVMAAGDIVELSETEDTDVGLGEASLEFLQREFPDIDPEVWEQTQVTFVAGSATDDEGNPATQAMIVPVDPQRLPAPLPPGADPGLVISIQAGNENGFNREAGGGATNFDVPAPVTFPNLEGLKPGEKSLIWTFNHDAGDWEIIGTGTVSEDGKSIVSDEGVGIRAPGWHFTNPGTEDEGDVDDEDDEDDDDDDDEVTFEAGISFDGEWTPLEISGKFGFELPTNLFANAVPGDESFQSLLWEPKYKPFDSLDFGGSASFEFTVSEFVARFVPEFDYTLFDAVGNAAIKGQAKAQAKIEGTGFNPVGKISGELALNVVTEVSGQIKNSPICNIPFGVGNFLCKKHELPEITLFGPPTIKIPEIEYAFPKTPRIDFNETIGPIAEISVGTQLKLSPRIFLREVDSSSPASSNLLPSNITPLSSSLNADSSPVRSEAQLSNALITEAQLSTASGFGNDPRAFYRYVLANGSEITGRTNEKGKYSTVLPPNTDFNLFIYSPRTNKFEIISGTSGASGTSTERTTTLSQVGGPDADGDGIPDFGEFTIGTDYEKIDTDNDGISDAAEIEQGLDPLGGQGFPTGIISSLPLQGEANAITVKGSTTDTQTQTAYVATGSHGLAIVDASQFDSPIILGQLDLLGDATDVAVDTNLQIAALATNSGGLQLVDVSDPMLPTLSQTVNISANKVEVVDGIAYATVGNKLKAIDLLTGDELQELTLPGSGTVTDLAREGNNLYAYTSGSDTFSVVDITNPTTPTVQGQVNVSVASSVVGISVGNGVAYLGGSGLRTIDISDPSNPTLIGDAEQFFTARDVTLNGSGLALVAAEGQGLSIYNVSDPADTDNFITQIDTPGFTNDVAIASGIAFVADGSSGLQVINYLGFDNQGQAPTVTITSPNADLDADVEGIQVLEGSSLPIQVDVEDDVQVRNVELLVNGEVVSNDVSFPFDLTATALNDDPEATTVDVQVRATDTGGNSTVSNTLTFNLVPDTFAPNVTSTSPKADGRRKNISGISVRFDEPIDTELLDLSGITLTNLGADEAVGGDDDTTVNLEGFESSETGRSLFVLPPAELVPGKYQLRIDPSIIADRAGNALTEAFTLDFTKRPLVTSLTLGETITGSIVEPGEDEVYTFEGNAGQRLYYDGISGQSGINTRLISPSGQQVLFNRNTSSNSQPFSLVETGTYQLIVDGNSDTTGDFSFRLSDLDEVTDLNLDTIINGTLDPARETDIFKFVGTKGQKLFFDNLENNSNASWSIYGPGNQRVESRNFFSDFEFTLEGNGNYIAVLEGFGNEGNEPVNYSFQVVTPETVTAELTLGEKVSSNISEAGEEDIYTFTGTAGQSLYYDGISGDSRINTRLISPSGEQIFSFFTNTSSDRQPFTLLETGTYQLIVDGNGDATGDYNFQLLDLADATDLTLDTTINGSLEPGQETVLYKFEGTENQKLFLEDKESQRGGIFVLYGSGDQLVTSQSFGFDREITLPGNGTYILAVQGSSNEETLNYSFSLGTSEITTTELTLGEIVSSNISKPGEEDIYTFSGTAGQRLYYDGISGQSGISTRLISPSGQQVLFSSNTSSNRQPFTLLESGTYQLIIDGNGGTTGDYNFQLLDLANATELTLDTTVNGSLEPGQETVLYKFEGTENQKLFLDDKGSQSGGTYKLYSPANQQVASASFTSDRDITLPVNGTYILALEGFSNEETLNYSFSVVTSEITTTELALGETVSSNISKSGEEDIYTFTGTAGQRLYYDGISGQSGISTRLISPSGEQVFSFNNTSFNREPFTLVENGTYQLIVDGNNATTGDYSFQLLDLASATDLTLNTEISGSLESGTESEIYKFTGEAGQQLSFEDKGSQSGGSYRLYSSANRLITSRSLRSNFDVTLPGDGTYFLVLQGSNNDAVNYRFQIVKGTLDDPGEPVGTELTLGEIVSSNIGEAEEQDTYIFTGTAGQTLYYDGISGNFRIDTRLISPSGVQLFNNNTFSNRQPFTLVESGTYQLIVDGSGNATGDYSFQLLDLANATDLTLDTTISGSLQPGQETVLYKFTGTQNQKLYLEDKGSDSGGSFVLYNPANQSFTSASFTRNTEITLPRNGTYILALQGSSNEETLNYSFSLGTSEITTTELTLGEQVSSNISKPGEEDIYTFSGTAGQTLYYDGISGDSQIDTRLISPSGEQIFSLFTNTTSDREPFTLLETGTYQLIVDGNSGTTGDYSFQLLDTASATDLTLDSTISGSLEPGQETVLYKFEGTQNQKFYLEDKGSQGSGSFRLYGPGNQQVTSQILGFDREITLPGNGTYILAVQGSSDEETLNYSFSLATSEITNTELTLGEIVSSNISKPGEEDIYTFSGTAGQRLYYDGISGDSQIDTRLISPSGEQIFSFFTNTSSNREPITLLETGTYQLIVDGNSETTGDYSFQLLDLANATELTLDTTINGSLEPGQETVLYKFEGNQNQKLFLEDKGSQRGGSFRLYGPGNQQVTSQSLGFDREITLSGNGTYILAVQGSSDEETLNYSFSLVTSEITTTELTLEEIVSSNISKPGEEDIYTFAGTAGQRLYYDGISGDSRIDTRLISPSGVQLFNINTVSDRQPLTLVESGTYQLIVDGNSGTTGVYSFQLLDLANATNIDLDTTINGNLDSGQQTILYKFEGTAEQQLSFEDLGSERFAGSYILYGPGNQFITSRSLGFDFQTTLPGDGIYFLAIQTNSNEEVNYSFQIS